jgi:hypothetical protein
METTLLPSFMTLAQVALELTVLLCLAWAGHQVLRTGREPAPALLEHSALPLPDPKLYTMEAGLHTNWLSECTREVTRESTRESAQRRG